MTNVFGDSFSGKKSLRPYSLLSCVHITRIFLIISINLPRNIFSVSSLCFSELDYLADINNTLVIWVNRDVVFISPAVTEDGHWVSAEVRLKKTGTCPSGWKLRGSYKCNHCNRFSDAVQTKTFVEFGFQKKFTINDFINCKTCFVIYI